MPPFRLFPLTAACLLAACLPVVAGMEVIAHRGAMELAPENTLAAQRLAYELGVEIVECDVRISRDGIPVIMHDHELDRTTNGTGPLASLTLAQIKELDAGSWFGPQFAGERVPTLAEMLAVARQYNRRILLDIKGSLVAPQVVAAIQESGIPLRQISFLTYWAEMTAGYTSRLPEAHVFCVPYVPATGLPIPPDQITAANLAEMRSQKVSVLQFITLPSDANLQRFHAAGFDVAVLYQDPTHAFKLQDSGFDYFWTDFSDVTVTGVNRLSQQWDNWAAKAGLAPDQQSTWMDPDGDGMTNLAEYALAADPLVPGNFPALLVTGPDTLGWTLNLRDDWSQFTTVTAQTSNGSGAWVNAPASCCTALSPVRVQFNFPVTPGRKFFRMKFDLVR